MIKNDKKKSCFDVTKDCSGVTLVELMVVIGIISIVSAVLIPSIILWKPNLVLSSYSKDVYGLIQKARMLAVQNNTTVAVVFMQRAAPNVSSCFIDLDGSVTVNQPEELEVFLDNEGVDFFAAPGLRNWDGNIVANFTTFGQAPPRVSFNSNGVLAGVPGSIFISHNPAKGGANRITYAITAVTSGALKMRTYSGVVPFNVNNWN